MNPSLIAVQTIDAEWLTNKKILLDVLRLDTIDPVISGNKWFKLKYYIADAVERRKNTIVTFGGAWSNHIVATAYSCKKAGLHSIGVIRGEKPAVLSKTLEMAQQYGMHLQFVSRAAYRIKDVSQLPAKDDWYMVNEGGYGALGAKGASEILSTVDHSSYTHIVAAVGTGTMLAGLLLSTSPGQKIIGISSMKANLELQNQIEQLTGIHATPERLELFHHYHFGGYAKHPLELIDYINKVYLQHQLPLDIVYTGKIFYAIQDLAGKGYFEPGSKLLMIHSGGLQGNKSLPPEVLVF